MLDVRLIDVNALKTEMADDLAATIRMSEMRKTDMAVRVLNKIDEANTIDAVPVVRCRECKYKNIPKCCPYQINGFKVENDWYCPMGVKMDGGADE